MKKYRYFKLLIYILREKKSCNKANSLKIHFNFNFYQFIFFIDVFISLINRKINILFFFFFWKNLIEKIFKKLNSK